MGFSRQEYWRGLPFPTLGDPPDRWIKPVSWVSCIGRWILYHCTACEAPCALYIATIKCTHSSEALLNFLHWPLPATAQCLKVETMYVLTITVNPVPSTWMNQQQVYNTYSLNMNGFQRFVDGKVNFPRCLPHSGRPRMNHHFQVFV